MTKRRDFLKGMAAGSLGLLFAGPARASRQSKRPNILWLTAEDMNPWMSCYGTTPHCSAIHRIHATLDYAALRCTLLHHTSYTSLHHTNYTSLHHTTLHHTVL